MFYTAVRFVAPGFWDITTSTERIIYAAMLGFAMRPLGLYKWSESVRTLQEEWDESVRRALATHGISSLQSRLVWDLAMVCSSERERAQIRNYFALGSLKLEMMVIAWILLIVVPVFAFIAKLVTWQFLLWYAIAIVFFLTWGRTVVGDGKKDLGRSYGLSLHIVRRDFEKDGCLWKQMVPYKNTDRM